MDVINQVLFLIILASFRNGKLENADLQKVASQLKVTHYDCGQKTENNLYALNQVYKSNNAPEILEISRAKITMYTKHFRQGINATVCRVKHQSEQWHCGFGDDSSMVAHHTGGITVDLTVTSSQCRTLAKGGSITLKDETLEFKKGVKTTVVKHKILMTTERTSATNTEMNATYMDGWIAKHLKVMYKTSCLKYVLRMAKFWVKTDYNHTALWRNLDSTQLHLKLTHTHGTHLTIVF